MHVRTISYVHEEARGLSAYRVNNVPTGRVISDLAIVTSQALVYEANVVSAHGISNFIIHVN